MMSTSFWATLALIFTLVLPSFVLAKGPAAPIAPAVTSSSNGAEPTPVDSKKAQADALYFEGRKLFLSGQFETALPKLQAAMALNPTANLKYNICRCLEGMKKSETVKCFEEFIQEFPNDDGVGYAARVVDASYQTAPPATTCTLVLKDVPADAMAKLNDKVIDASKPIKTDCLEQAVQVWRGTVQIGGGRIVMSHAKETVWVYEPNTPPIIDENKTSPKAEEPPLLTHKQWGWISVGVGALAAAAAGYFTYAMSKDFAEANKRNGNHAYTEGEFRSAVSDGESDRRLALVSGGIALVAGSLGGYLVLTGDDESPKAAIAPSLGGMVLTGTF